MEAEIFGMWIATDWQCNSYSARRVINGGGGLVSKETIIKPIFYALKMLNRLGSKVIARGDNYIVTRVADDEYQIMKNHVLYGEALLKDCPGEIMRIASILAKEHHERWDGKGYLGMKGQEIAYISRLISVCDVFDALTTARSYKKSWTVDEAYNEIVKNSGTQFDPSVVRLFIAKFDEFREIHDRIPDKKIY